MNFLSKTQLHIGPLTISVLAAFLIGAAAAAGFFLFFLLRRDKQLRRYFFDTLSTGILIVFAGWKLFPLFFSFHELITHPLTLLYIPGGIRGIMFGTGIGLLYVILVILNGKEKESRRMIRPFLIFTGIFIILSTLFMGVSLATGKNVEKNRAVPFLATTLEGTDISLDNLRGKTVILNFWATWCPPCRAELPTLVSFSKDLQGTSTILIGIDTVSSEKSLTAVKRFIHENGITYPVIPDTGGRIAAEYGITSLPTTVVISPEGIIREKHTGVVDYFWLRSHLSASGRSR